MCEDTLWRGNNFPILLEFTCFYHLLALYSVPPVYAFGSSLFNCDEVKGVLWRENAVIIFCFSGSF